MSNETSCELIEIARRLLVQHGFDLARAAGLIAITEATFSKMGLSESRHMHLLELQRECVSAWLQLAGVEPSLLAPAVQGMFQGAHTINYLQSLPD